MKKKIILCLLSLLVLPLAGCGEASEEVISEKVITALDAIKENSHKVNIKQTVAVLRPIPEGMTPEDPNFKYLPLDIYQEYCH